MKRVGTPDAVGNRRADSLPGRPTHSNTDPQAADPFGGASRRGLVYRLLIAAVLGVVHTQAFAPHDWWWLQILSVAGLVALSADAPRPRTAAATGFAFGLGWFLSGIWWLYISMHVYGEMPAWMAALAVVLFAGYLSIWPALAAGTWRWLTARSDAGVLAALAFGATWALSEWLRGVVFTGFPWLGSGYAHTDGPLAGFAPLVGVYGITFLAASASGLLVVGIGAWRRRQRHGARSLAAASAVIVAGVLGGGAALAPIAYTTPAGKPIHVRLLQGNVAQDIKFEPAGIQRSLELYRDLITAEPADLVVTPETAFPVILQELPIDIAKAVRAYMERTGTTVIFGAAGADSPVDFTNSVFAIGPEQEQLYRYNKHHLVPFGEFIPFGFRWFVDMMKMPLGDFRRGTLDQPAVPVRAIHVAPNICYEDLFGEEIATTLRQQTTPANMLANVTNLAWFGDTIALDQHLQISRMRALEMRRPMLRATNTGMTAVVRPDGSVQAKLPTFEIGTLSATVQGMQGLTPYIRWGNVPALAGSALILLLAWRVRRARRPS